MRVAILTQPLGHNYGGLLQAYALQTYLKKLGCQVETLDRRAEGSERMPLKVHFFNFARLMSGRIKSLPTKSRQLQAWSELATFRDTRLNMSPRIESEQEIRSYYRQQNFDAFLVGSDQVWRPRYSPGILNFYLDFLDDIPCSAKRISYAASFGVDDWEYPPPLTRQCRDLVQAFDAISVREQSAVTLCEEKFGVSAQWMVDPTLLLSPADYRLLIDQCEDKISADRLLFYVLDSAPEKQQLAESIAHALGTQVFSIKPEYTATQVPVRDLAKCRFPSVESWLQAFHSARFIVTDSFHGTVFSILFNKPFITLGNPARGMARFESLLVQFGLADRLIESEKELTPELLQSQIDWDRVNNKRKALAGKGHRFLKEQLLGVD